MRILLLHQNAPGQFRHLAPYLAHRGHDIVFLGDRTPEPHSNFRWLRYKAAAPRAANPHPYLRRMEASVRRGQAVARACLRLKADGFTPDLVVAHPGWGESLFLRDVLPQTRILSYCEMFYRAEGQDADYDDVFRIDLDRQCRLRVWNSDLLLALESMDQGMAPTAWQRAQHPAEFRPRITVIHDGVDTAEVSPNPEARFALPDGRVLAAGDEVVTFVARNLEPLRGFGALMRALPELCRQRPQAQIIICGEDGIGYGPRPPDDRSWREHLRAEVPVDPSRVHFVGRLSRASYLALLQVSALHLYLSWPFVLSWSCIEALAAGCLLLCSDVAPVREVIHDEEDGFLVDGRDPLAIAGRAADLLKHRARLGQVRATARARAARFELSDCLAQQEMLIARLAA